MKDFNNIIYGIIIVLIIWFSVLFGIVLGMGFLYEGIVFGVFVVGFIILRDFRCGVNLFVLVIEDMKSVFKIIDDRIKK